MKHALSPLLVGAVEAGQQDFEIDVPADVYAEHLAGDANVEALNHPVVRHEDGGTSRLG
ncbi:hypothetical protein RLDS_04195 [Sphingobium lactosutens DS20]|uniref:Uncharacterized protein n=1 Tax=Sphingobium lactosutens DS20 TaxID=1331060 RepID=T0J5A0_9SPHN|nr:hypothetical protein RLDS_04195 [Sphingobium lactosutens DS20]